MICPPNGIVLDCFAGSGSTLVAAIHEGFHFIGIEKEEEYISIARARIDHAMSTSNTIQPMPDIPLATSTPTKQRKKRNISNSSQLSLWDTEEAI
jgi:site-specific DNA-methyltransferase (adenine-specific)